jgi:hypothetical protein
MNMWRRLGSNRSRDGGRRHETEVVLQATRHKLCSLSGMLNNTTSQHATLLDDPAERNAWAHGNVCRLARLKWDRLSYNINISLYCSVAISIIPLEELHCKEGAIRRWLPNRNLHLHMSPVLEAHKLVRSCHGQCIRKMAYYFFPSWPWYPCQLFIPPNL